VVDFMKWRLIVVTWFFLIIISFISIIRPWGIDSGISQIWTLPALILPFAFPILSVLAIAAYRKIVLVIPFLFNIMAFFFCYNFQSWGTWKTETMFWYWTGAILACLFAIVSIISIKIYRKRILTFLDEIAAGTIYTLGLISNLGVILLVAFVILAGQSGM
jgi:hypothetical protein